MKESEKYQIIYADPPWQYGGSGFGSVTTKVKWYPANHYYQTIPIEELKKLDISSISAKDSLLFLWVPSPALKLGMELGKTWGFRYITVGFVWYKQRTNFGYYTMSSCELCLIFKKGKIPKPQVRNPGTKQFYSSPVRSHSQKPDVIRNRIKKMFPEANRIELFARKKAKNWDVWGNEIKNKIRIKKLKSIKNTKIGLFKKRI